jgi:hypothetical protein
VEKWGGRALNFESDDFKARHVSFIYLLSIRRHLLSYTTWWRYTDGPKAAGNDAVAGLLGGPFPPVGCSPWYVEHTYGGIYRAM